jgi:hypothetical protein
MGRRAELVCARRSGHDGFGRPLFAWTCAARFVCTAPISHRASGSDEEEGGAGGSGADCKCRGHERLRQQGCSPRRRASAESSYNPVRTWAQPGCLRRDIDRPPSSRVLLLHDLLARRCTPATAPSAASESLPTPPAAHFAAPTSTRTAGSARCPSASACRPGCREAGALASCAAARRSFLAVASAGAGLRPGR